MSVRLTAPAREQDSTLMRISESQLDHAFAEAAESTPNFLEWLLTGGRFRRFAGSAHLLVAEQRSARPNAKEWWKHWWCKLPDGSESETDVFLVFAAADLRFALHLENKPSDGVLRFEQAAYYRRRAALKSNDSGWLNYSDFEVILLAPEAFIRQHPEQVHQFDRAVTYEEVAPFAPLFGEALRAQG